MTENNMRCEYIKNDILNKWQGIIDIVTHLSGAHVGLIMQLCANEIRVHTTSRTPDNPYQVGNQEYLVNSGLYCERVIASHNHLLVTNARKSAEWDGNPDLKFNLVAYLGFPIQNPDGSPFGTICILDNKENSFSDDLIQLIKQARDQIEAELKIESLLEQNDQYVAKLNDKMQELDRIVAELKIKEKRYNLITENITDVIWVLNVMKGCFTYISPSIINLRGLTVEEAMAEPLEDSMTPESLAMVNQKIRESIGLFIQNQTQSKLSISEVQQPCKDGRLIWIEVTTRYVMNNEGEVELIGVSRDISERKERENFIHHLSTHDYLTDVYNRSYFETQAETALRHAAQIQAPVSLLILDLDLFKQFNDTYGHLVGDEVLKLAARAMGSALRDFDLLARFGGEEFIVLLPDTRLDGAQRMAEQIRLAIQNISLPVAAQLTVSIGVKEYQPGESLDDLFRNADTALYQAKMRGRNQVAVYAEAGSML